MMNLIKNDAGMVSGAIFILNYSFFNFVYGCVTWGQILSTWTCEIHSHDHYSALSKVQRGRFSSKLHENSAH